ncbi:hypothetical protein QBC39DRAFT_403436 [Podospora conica]|nr:hypothetical protein QBC39DRAFT_403436 [Schizothecium conicum]
MAVRTTVIGLAISMPLITTLFIAMRIYTRRRIKRMKLDPDDYLAIASLVFSYILSTSVFLGGVGNHLEFDLAGQVQHPDYYQTFAKTIWVMDFILFPSLGLTKLSILCFYKKIFSISRRFSIFAWISIVLTIVWTLGFFFANIFICVPIETNWCLDLFQSNAGKCVDRVKLFWATGVTDILTDLIILALPWPEIYGLHMSLSRKLQIAIVFMLGYFVVGADVARLVLSLPAVQSRDYNYDYTYTRAPVIYWTLVENNVSLICACLPTLRPLLVKLRILAQTVNTPLSGSHPSIGSRPHLVHSNSSPADGRPPPRPIYIRSVSAAV